MKDAGPLRALFTNILLTDLQDGHGGFGLTTAARRNDVSKQLNWCAPLRNRIPMPSNYYQNKQYGRPDLANTM